MANIRSSMPLIAAAGSSIGLDAFLTSEFGTAFSTTSNVWIYYDSAATLTAEDFRYWTPNNPQVTSVSINGQPVAADQNDSLSATQAASAVLNVGNQIKGSLWIDVPFKAPTGVLYQWYNFNTVQPDLMGLANGTVTASDIVTSAKRFATLYQGVPNDNDCWNIAGDVAAAAGATLPFASGSTDPTQNMNGGFWRVAYRGSDPNPVSNWQTLVKPGDIVRLEWADHSGPHSTTVLSTNADGSMTVFDNSYFVNGIEEVGIHTVHYDAKTDPTSVTIYRLDPNHIYLVQGGSGNDALLGSNYLNEIHTGAGTDVVYGGPSNDLIYLDGTGTKTVSGRGGMDTVIISGALSQYNITENAVAGTESISGNGLVAALSDIHSISFNDYIVNTTMHSEAAKLPSARIDSLVELYVAYFNRIPDAGGLSFWIDRAAAGESLSSISTEFYAAGIQYSSVTGYSSAMTNADFIKLVYANVLGRTGATAPNSDEIAYWNNQIATGGTTKEGLIQTMLTAAHAYASDPIWGWVPQLLNNKVSVGYLASVTDGLDYASPTDAIAKTVAIAQAVTPTDTSAAISLIGVSGHISIA